MYSKLILLIGAILSSLIVYFCLSTNKKETPIPISTNTKIKKEKQVTNTPKVVIEKPMLYFIYNNQIDAKLNFVDKNLGDFLKLLCKESKCNENIIYSEYFEPARWSKIVKESIRFFITNKITNFYIKANDNQIKIFATFKDKELFENFNKLIRENQDKKLKITNLSKYTPTKKEQKIQNIQKEINQTLKESPIFFAKNSSTLTKGGLKNLKKIISIFKKYKDLKFDLAIEGHTDATGDEDINRILSSKRAKSVKEYLQKHLKNLNYITSKGFGSSKPKYKNKKDPKNRRVEIIVKRELQW